MAGTRKSKRSRRDSADLAARVSESIKGIVGSGDRLVVGLSGGVDSVVLLDILARLAKRRRFVLSAIHVNHQLSPNAPAWVRFCRRLCRARGVPLATVKIEVARGEGVEAAARAARYDAFGKLRADYVVLAHNQDDQAETVLLQLLRGAGVKGLAAMPMVSGRPDKLRVSRRPFQVIRPLLDVPRTAIEAYARARALEWVEDESNAETYYLRNFLRRKVLPGVANRFPAYQSTLARAARHFAEAAQALDELAREDLARHSRDGTLLVEGLRGLSAARANNLLRAFLGSRGLRMPSTERLGEALRQALHAKRDAQVCIDLGSCELRRFAGALHLVPRLTSVGPDFSRAWRGERKLKLAELNGVLEMMRLQGKGISLARLQSNPVVIRLRRGGERLRPECGRPRRSLKNLLQEAGMPPWQREHLPLLFCGEDLVWVPGIGTACEYQAAPGERSIEPRWRWPVTEI